MVKLMDCTLRDGANVVGKGFDETLTKMMLEGLTSAHVDYIEMGNAGGIGAYEVAGFTNALTDEEYLKIAQPYLSKSHVGMFLNAKRYREKYVQLAAANGMSFLRVGLDADEIEPALDAIKAIKANGMQAFYSSMKAYLVTPEELVETAKKLEAIGLDEFTVMDSAGCMVPEEVAKAMEMLKKGVNIPVAFHGHNNLGMSAANAMAAYKAGADILDCGLMGMARSAGNMPTEACAALMHKYGEMTHVDVYKLLDFIGAELDPAMATGHDYHNPIKPFDLVLGMSGAHSSFGKTFKSVAAETGVNVYELVMEVSKENRKKPSEELIREMAAKLGK